MAGASDSQTGSTLLVLLREPDSPEAWKAFVLRYTPKLLAWCRQWKLQDADAQDVTQEVLHRLARLMRKLPYDPAKGRFRGWLKALARNAWSDLWEARRRAGCGSGDSAVQRLLDEQISPDALADALDPEFAREV
jgi:RNA polymerase sigma-70 factor (ECF subfamily)